MRTTRFLLTAYGRENSYRREIEQGRDAAWAEYQTLVDRKAYDIVTLELITVDVLTQWTSWQVGE